MRTLGDIKITNPRIYGMEEAAKMQTSHRKPIHLNYCRKISNLC
jgi:hypothetical protein